MNVVDKRRIGSILANAEAMLALSQLGATISVADVLTAITVDLHRISSSAEPSAVMGLHYREAARHATR